MKTKLRLIATAILFGLVAQVNAQIRYIDDVFSSVSITQDVQYGINISILTGTPANDTLKCDVYQPVGDTETNRPLVFVYHTGAFLPKIANGSALGDKSDSAIVEMCNRFAKKGYVAVAPNYRLGWNPTSTDQNVRTGTIINATYRATQDARNCIRFFRMDDATADTYKIDESKIAAGGLGSGGYIALSMASYQRDSETDLPKFYNLDNTPPTKYVDTSLVGNIYGTNAKTLNIPNYPEYSSDISMVFDCGGSVGDSSFIEAGEVPIVGFHCYKDPNAPFKTGNIYVSSTGDFVIEGTGNHTILRLVNDPAINNNVMFDTANNTSNVYTTRANQINEGYEGFFPFITPAPGAAMNCTGAASDPQKEQLAPWDWWNENYLEAAYEAYSGTAGAGAVANCRQLTANPNMSATQGRAYIDTIQGYIAPRMACALGLPGSGCFGYVKPLPTVDSADSTGVIGINDIATAESVKIAPNPATNIINITVETGSIKAITLHDLSGRTVTVISDLNTQSYTLQRGNIAAGIYIARITLSNGIISKRIILE